jgi:hypothetical protein
MLQRIRNVFSFIHNSLKLLANTNHNEFGYKSTKVNLGKIQATLNNNRENISSLSEVEFQVFSQFGDDGIIQYLISKIDIPNKSFIEFGVEKYVEANTRFLLINNNWRGLVIDGSKKNINYIKKDKISYLFQLYSKSAFITKDNINDLIIEMGFQGELGLLSIDIDGNDYWVWEAINAVNPVIVVCEYNADFGYDQTWTIPYQGDFIIGEKNPENYWGASLKALYNLAEEKGYVFVGCNSQGNNAYFIKKNSLKDVKKLECKDGYSNAKFFMVKDSDGNRVELKDRYNKIVGLPIFNTTTRKIEQIT